MADYDLYAVDAPTLHDALIVVRGFLPLTFCAHESSFIGDYFLADGQDDETFKIRENVDPDDGEAAEADFAGHQFLLYVDGTERGSDLRGLFEAHRSVTLLRHESL
ncbi:MAG TPA: hypothetical protein VK980_06855 [Sphingomonas sp.]|nr:hypothetical protein [Sphingomonas sp.]